jgi:Bifunctional DNA primase/polymerase, N-terminal
MSDYGHATLGLPSEVLTALELCQSVIPMDGNKQPLVRWKQYQEELTSLEQVLYWRQHFGDRIGGWARITGAMAGLIVFDDDKAGWMERFGLRPHVQTGSGGKHWIGKHPGWKVKTLNSRTCKRLGERYPNLDIRGDGGYSLIAGYNSRGGYTWLRDPEPDPLELLPQDVRAFFGLLEPPKARPEPARPKIKIQIAGEEWNDNGQVPAELLINRALAEARTSGRNNAGFWLCLQLRDNDYSAAEAKSLGRAYVEGVGPRNMKGELEPYTMDDFQVSVDQAYSQPKREAWQRKERVVTLSLSVKRPEGVPLDTPTRPAAVSWEVRL